MTLRPPALRAAGAAQARKEKTEQVVVSAVRGESHVLGLNFRLLGARSPFGNQPLLLRPDLRREEFRVDTALGEAAGDELEAGLAGGAPHVAELLLVFVEAPDAADARGDVVAEELAHEVLEAVVAGGEDDEVGGNDGAARHLCAVGDEAVNVRVRDDGDLAVDDEVGAADVEVVAAAGLQVLELPAVVLMVEAEAGAPQARVNRKGAAPDAASP